jgi:hypothetical protein
MENFFPNFPRYGKKFSTPWKTGALVRSSVRCLSTVASAKADPQACRTIGVNARARKRIWENEGLPFRSLLAVRRTWMQRILFGFWRGCFVITVRRPQDVVVGNSIQIWTGLIAKISCEFSDDAALRATRAGLVSASGRPRSGSAEKARLVFAPAKFEWNSRLFFSNLSPVAAPLHLPA